MRGTMALVLAAMLLVAGCATGGGKTAASEPAVTGTKRGPVEGGPATVIEVENFKLTKAKVIDLAGAGGGKAVVFTDEAAEAEYTVPALPKGTYDVVIFGVGQSDREDAVYIRVAGQSEERVFPDEWKKLLPFRAVRFTQPDNGPCKIVLSFGEENVQLDRVEIRPGK